MVNTLSQREKDVMDILWASEQSLTSSEITKAKDGLGNNTVQSVLRKLLQKEYITIAGIVYSGKVLCRSYSPLITESDYMLTNIKTTFDMYKKKIKMSNLVAALIDPEDSQEIEQLEKMLREYKSKLQN